MIVFDEYEIAPGASGCRNSFWICRC
ncbi:MAG: hypothetical protein ACLSA6_16360 [Holdemania massiliensis]